MEIELFDKKNRKLNASIFEEIISDDWIGYTFAARGGSKNDKYVRNPDYLQALELLLERLHLNDMAIQNITVESRGLSHLSARERQANIIGKPYPINLSFISDTKKLRKEITRATTAVNRPPKAKSSGNPTRRIKVIVSNSHKVDLTYGITDSKAPKSGGKSGPPPSAKRKAVIRKISNGFVYFLKLNGGEIPAIKIGIASNVKKRVATLNREIRTELTNCSWELMKWKKFPTERIAWEYEQDLIRFLKSYLVKNETEIVSLERKDFFQKVKKFDIKNKKI